MTIASHSVRQLRRNDVESYIQFGYHNWVNVYAKSVEVKYIIGFFHLLINVGWCHCRASFGSTITLVFPEAGGRTSTSGGPNDLRIRDRSSVRPYSISDATEKRQTQHYCIVFL